MRRAALLAGIAAPLVKAAGIVAAGRVDPRYDHATQAISELSARGAPSAALHRSTTVASGLLQLAFADALLRRRFRLLAGTYATVGFAALGSTAWPCSPGCPPPGSDDATRSDALHNFFGFAGGAALIAAPVFGLGRDAPPSYRRGTIALATATLVTGGAALGGLTGSRKGLWQRAFQLSSHTWQAVAAWQILVAEEGRRPGRRGRL